jgi:hypothetical protein
LWVNNLLQHDFFVIVRGNILQNDYCNLSLWGNIYFEKDFLVIVRENAPLARFPCCCTGTSDATRFPCYCSVKFTATRFYCYCEKYLPERGISWLRQQSWLVFENKPRERPNVEKRKFKMKIYLYGLKKTWWNICNWRWQWYKNHISKWYQA